MSERYKPSELTSPESEPVNTTKAVNVVMIRGAEIRLFPDPKMLQQDTEDSEGEIISSGSYQEGKFPGLDSLLKKMRESTLPQDS